MFKWLYNKGATFCLLMALLLVGLTAVPLLTPVIAKEQPTHRTELLIGDEVRVDPYTKVKVTKEYTDANGQKWKEVEMSLSSLPQTLDDLKTEIVCEWVASTSSDGVSYYETGFNTFYARVTGNRVAVENNGILAAWDPVLYLNGKAMKLTQGPERVKDPYNPHYGKNTLKWVYTEDTGILGIFGNTAVVTRYVRQIEGQLQEIFVLEEDPEGTLKIVNQWESEEGFAWAEAIWAADSAGHLLDIKGGDQEKVIDAREFGRRDLVYPVTIDPTTTFDGSYKDGWLRSVDSSYSVAWAGGADALVQGTFPAWVGQDHSTLSNAYTVDRSYIYFDTSALPNDAEVTFAELKLYTYLIYYDGVYDTYLEAQNGMPTYPHDTLILSDFEKSNYSGAGLSTSSWYDYLSAQHYESFYFSSTGQDWINSSGWTKLALRSSNDIDGEAPGSGEAYTFSFYQSEYGSGYAPELVVVYQIPVTKPIVDTRTAQSVTGSTATLRGYLSNDGNADCNVWFEYGTTTAYGTPTLSYGGYETGDSFSQGIAGLEFGTLYHYTAKAQNSGGTSDDDDQTFLTLPDIVTSFTVTPGDEQNGLSWTKGTGSSRTMIRRSTSGYPSTISSGTQVYFDSGTSTTDTGLTNGTTYYYSAWAEVTTGGWQQYAAVKVTGSGIPYSAGPPTGQTNPASSVTSSSAILNGYLSALNGAGSVDTYFEWGEQGGGMPNTETSDTLTQPDSFSYSISGLDAATTYEFRAKLIGDGTSYGSTLTFTTGDPSAPTMTTNAATGVSMTQAVMWGLVTDDGGAVVTGYFEWGLTTSYGEETSSAAGLYSDDQFFETLTGLDPSTTYHFRAVGENTQGTSYGVDKTFTTDAPDAPEVLTLEPSNVGATSAVMNGQVTDDGGVDTDVRFTWSTNSTLATNTTSSNWQTGYNTGETFDYFAYNLTIDTTYYYRAEAQNDGGSYNSTSIKSFTTIFAAPENFAAVAISSESILLSWEPQSDKTLIIAKEGSFPADRLDGYQVYFGPGSSTTYDGLVAGTTYFFRAWSWRTGDNFSDSYAEDAATTTSGAVLGSIDTPYGALNTTKPEAPSTWWQGTRSDTFTLLPGVTLIDSVAAANGISQDAIWTIIASVLGLLLGVGVFGKIPATFAMLSAGGFTIFIMSLAGVIAMFIMVPYVLVGGSLAYLFKGGL